MIPMAIERVTKTTQEQTVGAYVESIVMARFDELRRQLDTQDQNFEQALALIDECNRSVYENVIERFRGGEDGMAGYIAEWLEVYLGNAKDAVMGKDPVIFLDNDNGPVDYHVGEVPFQSKFVLKFFSLDSIREHARNNHQLVEEGLQYSFPVDFYEKVKDIASVPESDVHLLPKTDQTIWNKVRLLKEEGVELDKNLHPSAFRYLESRREHVDETIAKEEASIRETDREIRAGISELKNPTLGEAAKSAAAGAALEAGAGLAISVYKKIKDGKRVEDFTVEDWKDLGLDTVTGAAKGGVRGAAVYGMVSIAHMPGATAAATVTAAYGMASQADLLRSGKITRNEFIENSEVVCIDSAISALSSILGQTVIPIPVLGALVGSIAGDLMLEIANTNLSTYEALIVADYHEALSKRSAAYGQRYLELVQRYETRKAEFGSSLALAFSEDVDAAFRGSIKHAEYLGVPSSKLIKSDEEGIAFFES